jgi:hypothetical protein
VLLFTFAHILLSSSGIKFVIDRSIHLLIHAYSIYLDSFQSSSRNEEGAVAEKTDLTGRGLCLVPISSTFVVAGETPVVDFWNPFGAAFR